jgi:hypothetical protein
MSDTLEKGGVQRLLDQLIPSLFPKSLEHKDINKKHFDVDWTIQTELTDHELNNIRNEVQRMVNEILIYHAAMTRDYQFFYCLVNICVGTTIRDFMKQLKVSNQITHILTYNQLLLQITAEFHKAEPNRNRKMWNRGYGELVDLHQKINKEGAMRNNIISVFVYFFKHKEEDNEFVFPCKNKELAELQKTFTY